MWEQGGFEAGGLLAVNPVSGRSAYGAITPHVWDEAPRATALCPQQPQHEAIITQEESAWQLFLEKRMPVCPARREDTQMWPALWLRPMIMPALS